MKKNYKKRKNHTEITKQKIGRAMQGHIVLNSTKKKIGKANTGSKNGLWKGDDVGYGPLHSWIKNHKPKIKFCEVCNKKKVLEIANVSGKYKRDINDYMWLCRSCHMKSDGRLKNLNIKKWKKN